MLILGFRTQLAVWIFNGSHKLLFLKTEPPDAFGIELNVSAVTTRALAAQ